MKVALVYDPIYLEHQTGAHVENPQRLTTTMSLLEETRLKNRILLLLPRPATVEELSLVHALEYISYVRNRAQKGGGWLDADTVISSASYEVALYAAGGALQAVEAVMTNQADSAFAMVRPPGHHATCWQAMGFCLFNNIAVAARFVLSNFDNIKRILIVDFDVHHGNGTQDTFYTDPRVLYFSIHQYPLYPGTGSINEIGSGNGEGTTVNVPLLAGWGDDEYLQVFQEVLVPVAERYQPQLILVSAGYDAHWADSIALMQVSVSGFAGMVRVLKNLATKLCLGRLIFALEGGYHHQALASSIVATLEVLLDSRQITDPLGSQQKLRKPLGFGNFLKLVKETHHLKAW